MERSGIVQLDRMLGCISRIPGSRISECIFRFAEATGHEVVVIDLPENGSEAPAAPKASGNKHHKAVSGGGGDRFSAELRSFLTY